MRLSDADRDSFRWGLTGGLALLLLMGVIASSVGYLVPLGFAYQAIRYGGVLFFLLCSACWLSAFVLLLRRYWVIRREEKSRSWLCALALLAGAAGVLWGSTEPRFGVMDDEGTLANTALSIYETGEVFSAHRGYWIEGDFEIVDGRLDKRPALISFLVAMMHHATGYHLTNGFYLNMALGLLSLAAFWMLLREVFSSRIATVALLPFACNPVWLQVCSGGGLEPLSFFLAILLGWGMWLHVVLDHRRITEAFMVFSAVLLAYTRYEAALWALPVGFVLLLGASGPARYKPGWAVYLVPWMLVPAIWLLRLSSARVGGFQHGGTDELPVFSLSYLWSSFSDSLSFLFYPSWWKPNDLFLSVLGLGGLAFALYRFIVHCIRTGSFSPRSCVLACWLLGFGLLYLIFAAYFWSSFHDALAVRFSLVLLPPLVMGFAYLLNLFATKLNTHPFCWIGACVVLLLLSLPNLLSLPELQKANPHAAYQNWKLSWLESRSPSHSSTFFIDTHPHVWTASRFASITYDKLGGRLKPLAYQFDNGGFRDIFLVETLVLNRENEWVPVFPEMRDHFEIELIDHSTFDLTPRLRGQISRVIKVKQSYDADHAGQERDIWYLP